MSLITPEQSRGWYENRGLVLGEQCDDDDTPDRCSECDEPTLADELVVLDGQDVCVPCLVALTGDDVGAPDRLRDL